VQIEKMVGIDVELRNHVVTIAIDRPERHNAVTPDQMNYVGEVCTAAETEDDVRVVVIRGTGDAFCAGGDLDETDLSGSGGQIPPLGIGGNLYLPIVELSKPLIGVINGAVAGGGLGLALCCDIRLASDRARFNTAFSRIGLTANDTVGYLLPRVVGIAKSLELIYLSRSIDAVEAARIGLVSYVRPHDELEAFAAGFVAEVAAGPPAALRFSKRLVLDGLSRTYREHVMAQEYAALANRVLANHDIIEGIEAFKEKRPPRFKGILAQRRWRNY